MSEKLFDGTGALAGAYHPRRERQAPRPVVRRPAPRRGKRVVSLGGLVTLTVAAVLCMLAFASLSQLAHSANLQKQANALEKQLATIQEGNRVLQQQIAAASSGEIVRNHAVNKLGMVLPSGDQVRRISLPPLPQVQVAQTQPVQRYQEASLLHALLALLD